MKIGSPVAAMAQPLVERRQRRHGGNIELQNRDPKRFRFSILQRVSPDMEPADVIAVEATWKVRLHTREFGHNRN
jgi:hypothetical protein